MILKNLHATEENERNITLQWNLYSGDTLGTALRTTLGTKVSVPEWRLGWEMLMINQ